MKKLFFGRRKYVVMILTSFIIYTIHAIVTRHGIYGDGNGYYAIAHTLFFERKLNFTPIYAFLSQFQGTRYVFSRIFWDVSVTSNGVLNCPWLPGTALFWLPSFLVVWIIQGLWGIYSPFTLLYELGCGYTGSLLMIGGLYFLEMYMDGFVQRKWGSIGVILLFFCTQCFYYAAFEPGLSHQPVFFMICLLLYLSKKKWTGLILFFQGFISGVLFSTRMVDVFWLIPLYLNKNNRIMPLLSYIVYISGVCVGVLPGLLFQYGMYGSLFTNPYLTGGKGSFFHYEIVPSFFSHLFSQNGGLFLWSPLLLLGFFGASRTVKISFVLFVLIVSGWHFGPPSGFGNRFMIGAIPFLVVGMVDCVKQLKTKVMIGISIGCFAWNVFLLGQFYLR